MTSRKLTLDYKTIVLGATACLSAFAAFKLYKSTFGNASTKTTTKGNIKNTEVIIERQESVIDSLSDPPTPRDSDSEDFEASEELVTSADEYDEDGDQKELKEHKPNKTIGKYQSPINISSRNCVHTVQKYF